MGKGGVDDRHFETSVISAFSGRDREHAHSEPALVLRKKGTTKRVPRRSRTMHFNSLHHHSTFSYLDGFQLPEAHVRRAVELNMPALAMTEHGNVSSHVKLELAAKAQGIKPIFGCELYCGAVDTEGRTQRKNHLTVLAENAAGYRSLLRLVSRSFAEGFYHEPTVSGDMLADHKDGLIILSGCLGSLLATSLIGGKLVAPEDASYERGREVAARFRRTFGDAYYLEVQAFPELDKTVRVNMMIERISQELHIPIVATMDCHYTVLEENELQQILHNVRGGGRKTLEEQAREWGYDVPLCPPPDDRSIYRRLRMTGIGHDTAVRAILASEEIAARCTVELPSLPTLRYPLPDGYEAADEVWRDWLRDGWAFRGCDRMPRAKRIAYQDRLQYEMGIIESKDYCDYFLVVSDAVRWAKDNGIPVGPARGSAAASLVCWMLRITEVNPMDFPDLVFERFIDITREDMPDIDLDFDSDQRYRIRDYLVTKYGAECVSNIGTFSTYKARVSLDDVARVHKIPKFEVEIVKEALLERSSGDMRASATIEDTVEQFVHAREVFERYPDLARAMDLEGNIKGFGVHAAGLVVSNGPITDVCAVYRRTVKGHELEVISLDKYDAERKGLIKMDFLGLSTMAMVAEALRDIGMGVNDLYGITFDDEEVIDGFRRNDVTGIFQFDGLAMRSVNGQLQPDTFAEICDINALARPGPLHNGAAESYINIKRKLADPVRVHPALDRITAHTNYQIVYQEQILRIVREIGGFDWTHAAYIRKIISRKIGEQEFNRQWGRFWEGAQRLHGMKKEVAEQIWKDCITSGSYAFNHAHSVSYGMLAYWTMWLKVKHPATFFAASLSKMADTKRYELLRDAAKHGLDILPPDPRESGRTWRRAGSVGLQAGFCEIAGIGEKTAAAMLARRADEGAPPVTSWASYGSLRGIGPKTINKVTEFCEQEDPFEVFALEKALGRVRDSLDELGLPHPTHASLDVPYEKGTTIPVTWLGVIRYRNLRDIFEINRARGEEIDPETINRPDLNESVWMRGDDGEENIQIYIDRFRYPQWRTRVWSIELDKDVVLVQGVKPKWKSGRAIYVNQMWIIDPE